MNRGKIFTALAQSSTEYATYYGVLRVRYADFQRLAAMASLVVAAKQTFPEADSLSVYDGLTTWFEAVPWSATGHKKDDGADDEDTTSDIESQLSEGYWVEVPEGDVDEEADEASPTRTVMERMNIYSTEFGSTFFEKHGDTQFSSPWILLSTIAEFFSEPS